MLLPAGSLSSSRMKSTCLLPPLCKRVRVFVHSVKPVHVVVSGPSYPLTVLTLYSVKTGLAATHIYGLMDALSPAIWVGSRLGRGVI